jgi:hypothetical protein
MDTVIHIGIRRADDGDVADLASLGRLGLAGRLLLAIEMHSCAFGFEGAPDD